MKNFTKTQKIILSIVTIPCVAVSVFLGYGLFFSNLHNFMGELAFIVYLFGIFAISLCLAFPLLLSVLFAAHNKNKQFQDTQLADNLNVRGVGEDIKN